MDGEAVITLIGFFAACILAASSAAIYRPDDWYERLAKPSWQPPGYLFGPVWMVLYAMIAVSGWLVWRELGWVAGALPLGIYAVQLVLNGLWSVLFFGTRRMGLACVEMAALWLAILATIGAFYPVRADAALLLIPYLAWVSFAFALNFTIWRLNAARTVAAS